MKMVKGTWLNVSQFEKVFTDRFVLELTTKKRIIGVGKEYGEREGFQRGQGKTQWNVLGDKKEEIEK